ncbi:MAG: hypothetical protein J5903_01825 [Clostridia bacterium]|nr:hypothetical protein [Clostridia bacterium]
MLLNGKMPDGAKKRADALTALLFLGIMCFDQFVVALPYENVVFPLLAIAALEAGFCANVALIGGYSLIFELSCVAWMPTDIFRVSKWLVAVFIGYSMTYLLVKATKKSDRENGVLGIAVYATVGEILYYWVSVAATCVIWRVPFVAYLTSDLPYEIAGAAATFLCALPIAFIYKKLSRRNAEKRSSAIAERAARD